MESYYLLERRLGEWCGIPSVVACSSGTAALHLALESFRLDPGYVIVPDFTMIACARAVHMAGLKPVFVDCDEQLLMDHRLFRAAVQWCGKNLRAVMAVHIYGRQENINRLVCIMEQEHARLPPKVYLVEDVAEAHGLRPHPLTDAACWSFYKNKVVAGEEGGAVAFRESMFSNNARSLRCLGFTPGHDFMHLPGGHNYRLANCLADKIMLSLEDYEYNLAERRRIEMVYNEHCYGSWRMLPRDIPWVYDLRISGLRQLQDRLVNTLKEEGVAARHAFKPMSIQQEFSYCPTFTRGQARRASEEIIYLPIQPNVTSDSYCKRALDVVKRTVPLVPGDV